jgi:tripartite ATP-independent transporter DctM subunit
VNLAIMLATFAAALAVGVPVAFALGVAGFLYVCLDDKISLDVLPTVLFGGMDSFTLLAIPFFIMAGDLLLRGGLLDRLIDFAKSITGSMRGGLAQVNISASMLFGGVTGVALADVAAIGATLVPAMVREGYRPSFAAAVTASSSVMGAIIPPSIAMLIVAYIFGGRLSIAKMFLSGATPGLLIGLGMMLVVAIRARSLGLPVSQGAWSVLAIVRQFRRASLSLGVPVIVIGGILGGWFTATEAGAIAVFYAIAVGCVVMRTLGLADLAASLLVSGKTSAMVFLLLANAKLIAFILVINQVPQSLVDVFQPYVDSPQTFMIGTAIVFLLLGFFLDGIAAMIMLVPVVAPMAAVFGAEPHHLALVIVMVVQVALLTPPVALGLFVVTPFAGCSLHEAALECIPFVLVILAVILLVIFVPEVAMWLPSLAGY